MSAPEECVKFLKDNAIVIEWFVIGYFLTEQFPELQKREDVKFYSAFWIILLLPYMFIRYSLFKNQPYSDE